MTATVTVVTDELCTMLVARIPMKRPTSGVSVTFKIDAATSPPSIFRDVLMSFMLKRKRKRNKRSLTTRDTMSNFSRNPACIMCDKPYRLRDITSY